MAALMRFQRTSDEMTGVTAWVDPVRRPMWSDMAELWVQGKEVTTRVDYSRVPQNETLAVNSEDVGTAHEQIFFYAKDPGQSITFNRTAGRRLRTAKWPSGQQGGCSRGDVPCPAHPIPPACYILCVRDTPLRTVPGGSPPPRVSLLLLLWAVLDAVGRVCIR